MINLVAEGENVRRFRGRFQAKISVQMLPGDATQGYQQAVATNCESDVHSLKNQKENQDLSLDDQQEATACQETSVLHTEYSAMSVLLSFSKGFLAQVLEPLVW